MNAKDKQYMKQIRDLFNEHNIAEVTVDYSGGGDSGSSTPGYLVKMDGTRLYLHGSDTVPEKDEEEFSLLIEGQPCVIQVWTPNGYINTESTRDISFSDLMMEVADYFVDRQHGGWANNEGGRGTVTISRPREGIEALAEVQRQRITVLTEHVDYIQTEEASDHVYAFDIEDS